MVLLKNKGQSEIIGLVIIVLILIIVGLIFLKFYLNKGKGNNDSFSNVKANNLVNAIKLVTICNDNMVDAIIACCNQKEFCRRDSCELVEESIREIIESSLEEDVYFEAKQQDNLCLSINEDCSGITSTENFIRNQDGEAKISVKMCY